MSVCQIEEREAGRSYPRTCPICKLGKCSRGQDYASLKARIAELEAANKALHEAQTYNYIGKDGKPRLARDMEDRIEELERTNTQLRLEVDHNKETTAITIHRADTAEAKLATADVLKDAQQLFNYYAVEIVTYGATIARLRNLEDAWSNLKTLAELKTPAELKGGA